MPQFIAKITNTGKTKGTEVAQLYLSDSYASMLRPVQELQGFARVELEPGKTKKVLFEIVPSQMAFLTKDMNWKIEAGKIQVFVGASAIDHRLESSFHITENAFVESSKREFYAKVTVFNELH